MTNAGTVTAAGVVHLPDGRRTFAKGNQAPTTHGGRSRLLSLDSPEAIAIGDQVDELVRGTPAEGPSFAAARATLVLKLVRLGRVRAWIDEERGGLPLDEEGRPLPAVALERELTAAVEKSLADLGLTPRSAAALGVDLIRGTESLVERLRREEAGE